MTLKHDNLWAITREERLRYLGIVLALGAANGLMFGAPLIAKSAIDVVVQQDITRATAWLVVPAAWLGLPLTRSPLHYLLSAAGAVVLVTALACYFQYRRGQLSAVASESIARRLRDALYRRLSHLRAAFYDSAETGDLVQRCSSDVDTLRVFYANDVVEVGRVLLLLALVVPILFSMHIGLAWLAVVTMPLQILAAYVFFSKVKAVFEQSDVAEAAMTAVLQENLTGVRVVRAFARQDYEIARFAARNAQHRDGNFKLIRLMGIYATCSDFVCFAQLGLVLIVGGLWAMEGQISVGTLFAFLTCESMVLWPVRQLGRVLSESGKAVVALGRVCAILDAEEEPAGTAPNTERAHARSQGELRFDHVTFGYDPARPVIHDFSLHVRAGETLAIVGAPGSGKTTLIRLLLRLYAPQAGALWVDDRDVSTASRPWLRLQIGVVLQDPFLYSRTIEDNLRVGRSDAQQDALERASQAAALHDAILGFSAGYRTLVGERGVTLSGGQRQRLALARALLKEPPVLVLDDSLSAVDTKTEAQILSALHARKGRQTTLIIAHRLSSVMHADRILVLEHGRAVQLGDHATLARADGPYRRLVHIQSELDTEISTDIRATARG